MCVVAATQERIAWPHRLTCHICSPVLMV